MNSIQSAIEQAKAAAAATPAQMTPGLPAQVPQTGGPLTLASMMTSGGVSVDTWLKVDKHGMTIGEDRTIFDELDLAIDLSEVRYCYCLKYGTNPVTYEKSYDRVTNARGGTWADAILKARTIDPKLRGDYPSAELPFVALADIAHPKTDAVILEAGKRLGHTLSTTGWSAWNQFIGRVRAQGLNPELGLLAVKLGFEFRKNNSGHEWGVLKFVSFDQIPALPWEDDNGDLMG